MTKTRHQREITEDPSPLVEYTPPKRTRKQSMAHIEEDFEVQDPHLPQNLQALQDEKPGPRDSPNNPFSGGAVPDRGDVPDQEDDDDGAYSNPPGKMTAEKALFGSRCWKVCVAFCTTTP